MWSNFGVLCLIIIRLVTLRLELWIDIAINISPGTGTGYGYGVRVGVRKKIDTLEYGVLEISESWVRVRVRVREDF